MDGTKQSIRQEMRRRRRALSDVELSAAEHAAARDAATLPAYQSAARVLLYVAAHNEVPTGRLIEAAFENGKRVYLPRLRGDLLDFAEHRRGDPLSPGSFGIPEPSGPAVDPAELIEAVAFVPLVAWDASGMRLGRGGGHYDRSFSGTARPRCLVGLGYTFQQLPALPRDEWDLQLDWVVTERGAVRCWRAGACTSASRKEDTTLNGIRSDGADHPRVGRRADVAGRPAPETTS